jgi:hypothetical protein
MLAKLFVFNSSSFRPGECSERETESSNLKSILDSRFHGNDDT